MKMGYVGTLGLTWAEKNGKIGNILYGASIKLVTNAFMRYQKQDVKQSRRGWIEGMRALLGLIRNYKK